MWKKTEENNYPDKTGYYLIVLIVDNQVVYKVDFWNSKNFESYDFYVVAWCELPVYN